MFQNMMGEAQSSEDTSFNNFTDKFALSFSKNCALTDSAIQELSTFIYDFLLKIKKIRSTNSDRLINEQKRVELRVSFEKGLKEKFGNCVYKNYKRYIDRYPDKVPKRNTGRKRE